MATSQNRNFEKIIIFAALVNKSPLTKPRTFTTRIDYASYADFKVQENYISFTYF